MTHRAFGYDETKENLGCKWKHGVSAPLSKSQTPSKKRNKKRQLFSTCRVKRPVHNAAQFLELPPETMVPVPRSSPGQAPEICQNCSVRRRPLALTHWSMTPKKTHWVLPSQRYIHTVWDPKTEMVNGAIEDAIFCLRPEGTWYFKKELWSEMTINHGILDGPPHGPSGTGRHFFMGSLRMDPRKTASPQSK